MSTYTSITSADVALQLVQAQAVIDEHLRRHDGSCAQGCGMNCPQYEWATGIFRLHNALPTRRATAAFDRQGTFRWWAPNQALCKRSKD